MLNAALIMGLCASFLNLGDLLLRPNQKRAFEEYFGTLVLWLDYKRPLHWFSRLDKPSRTYILTTGMVLVLCGLVALPSDRILFEGLAFVALLLGLSFLQCAWFWERWWMNEGFRYVVGDGTAKTFAVRLAWIPLATLLYTIIATVASQFWFGLVAVLAFTLWVLSDHPRVYWAAIGASWISVILIRVCVILFLLETALLVARWIGWRIVEYSKGAWAAIILLATTGLGIVKLAHGF